MPIARTTHQRLLAARSRLVSLLDALRCARQAGDLDGADFAQECIDATRDDIAALEAA